MDDTNRTSNPKLLADKLRLRAITLRSSDPLVDDLTAAADILMSLPVETSGPIAVADAFEEVLRVEIASDTPEKVEKFRVALCDLIFDAPAAGNHDVMVTIHKGDSIPVFETNRSPVEPSESWSEESAGAIERSSEKATATLPESNDEQSERLAKEPGQPQYRKWPGEPPHCMSCDCGMTEEQKLDAARVVPIKD